jgi:hypothetical protein
MAHLALFLFFTPPSMGGDMGRVKYPAFLVVTLS